MVLSGEGMVFIHSKTSCIAYVNAFGESPRAPTDNTS